MQLADNSGQMKNLFALNEVLRQKPAYRQAGASAFGGELLASHFSLRRSSVSPPCFTVADDLTAAGAMFHIVQLSKALAAVFVLRFNLYSAQRAVVDDERIHNKFLPLGR